MNRVSVLNVCFSFAIDVTLYGKATAFSRRFQGLREECGKREIDSALSAMINISDAGGIEIGDFVLIGHSAGGHLALMYAYVA